MSPGGLNGSGIHKLPLGLEEPRRKSKPRAGLIASVVAALSTLGGGGYALVQHVDARAEAVANAVAITKLEVESASHAKQFERVNVILEKHSDRLEDMAVFFGVPRDYRKAPNLGVQPMPAASRSRPKPREPQ